MHPFMCHVSSTLLPAQVSAENPNSQISWKKKQQLQYIVFWHGNENTSQLHLLPTPTFPSFHCCIQLLSNRRALLARQPLFLTCGYLQTWLLPSPTEMYNPRWEQRVSAFSKTQFRSDRIWSYPRLSALSTWGVCVNSHDSWLSNQLEGQSLASCKKRGNSCLSCHFWETQFRMKTWTEPITSETKARNSKRRVANQYSLLLRHSGRHATHLQISCIGISHLPSLWFAFFMKEVRPWSNLKSF